MFSTLTDRSAPRDFSPRETDSEVNDNGKRRRIESSDDHLYHRRASSHTYHPPANVRDNVYAPAVRILTRRYLLTTTGYKHLAIGVVVKPPSYVEIVLGDRNSKEISLSLNTWKELVERKRDIVSYLRSSDLIDGARPAPITVGDLTLQFGSINNLPILRMEQPNGTRLAMSLNTLLSLYDLQLCVDRIVSTLSVVIKDIDEKYSRYREIAANAIKTETSAKTAIMKSEFFDPANIVDCEIVALCFKY